MLYTKGIYRTIRVDLQMLDEVSAKKNKGQPNTTG